MLANFENRINDIKKVRRREKSSKAGRYRSSQSSLMRSKRAEERDIGPLPDVVDHDRKKRCERDFKLFCETYNPEPFYFDWADFHLRAMRKIEDVVLGNALYAFAMPRGSGKTTLCKMGAIWAILYGHKKYVFILGSTDGKATDILSDIKVFLQYLPLIGDDFPEVVYPIRQLENISNRARGQTCDGEPTLITWRHDEIIMPTIEESSCSGARLAVSGLTGDGIRGSAKALKSGEIIRPDLVLLDDPQTDESARSERQNETREKLVAGAVLGMAGPGRPLSALMPCTIIEPGDMVHNILDAKKHPEWRGETTSLLFSLPVENEKTEEAWEKYYEIYDDCVRESPPNMEPANDFYRKNQAVLEVGAEASWDERKIDGDVSAIQYGMNLKHRDERAFWAEYMNDPKKAKPSIYDLTVDIVMSKRHGCRRFEVPESANFLTMMIDVNQYGLNWTMVSWREDFTGWVVDYGIFPGRNKVLWSQDKTGGKTESQAIFDGIVNLIKLVFEDTVYTREDGNRMRPDGIMVDGNYMTETIFKAIDATKHKYPVKVDRGRSCKYYRPAYGKKLIGRIGNNYHQERGPKGAQVVHNADFWRMATQKAFLLKPGAPGALSLYNVKSPADHARIASEVCSETLVEYVVGDRADFYLWHLTPGARNDLLDCLVGCSVAAAICGADFTGGEQSWRAPKKKATRKKRIKPKKINI